jgi:hypothetical protein
MRTSRKRKANRHDWTIPDSVDPKPQPPQLPQVDSLYVAAVISGASIFSWILAIL